MYHYQENLTDSNGSARNGWSMGLYAVGGDPETAPAVTIYSDRAGTAPIPGGKVLTVEKGLAEFYIPSGTYSRRYFDSTGAFQYAITDTDMISHDDLEELQVLEARVGMGHAQNFWRRIRAMQDDVYLFVNSDSTWNESVEPFYRWAAEYLCPAATTHTVVYRLWVDGSGWNTPTTLQTGASGRTIYIDNCAVPGSGLVYLQGANEVAIFADNRVYDLFIVNHGHNVGPTTTEEQNYSLLMSAMASWMYRHAKADFIVTLQNPWLRNLAFSRATQAGWRRIANELGLGIIDVASRFEALGDLDDPAIGGEGGTIDLAYYEQDGQGGLHPAKPSGVDVALPALALALAEAPATGAVTMLRPFNRSAVNLMPNPKYTAWTGSTPDSHTFSNVTPAKSVAYAERGLYGMALTCGAGNPVKSVDLSSILPMSRGDWVSYLARVWVPAGMSTTAGRAQLLTTGASNRSSTSQPSSVGRGGWRWVMACHRILDTDISITANLLCGDSGGADSGLTFYVDREIILVGTIPAELDTSSLPAGFLSDYYNFAQTGIPTGFTGTLALSGTGNSTITVTGGTANLTRAYGNIATVPGRSYRIAWGTRTVTGAAGCTISARGLNGLGTVITTSGTIASNGSLTFTATGSAHSFSINGGSNVTGFSVADITITEVFSGINPTLRPHLANARNTDGTVIDATGAAGKFRLASTVGTSLALVAQAATGTTRTETAMFEVSLPSSYIPGRDFNVTVNALRTGTGTAGTNTVDVSAYRIADAGTQGADLVTTASQTLTGSAADYVFAATGTSFVPGERVLITVTTAITETGGVNSLTGQVNSVRVS